MHASVERASTSLVGFIVSACRSATSTAIFCLDFTLLRLFPLPFLPAVQGIYEFAFRSMFLTRPLGCRSLTDLLCTQRPAQQWINLLYPSQPGILIGRLVPQVKQVFFRVFDPLSLYLLKTPSVLL